MLLHPFSLLPLSLLILTSTPSFALTPWESIHQTIHTYPLAIDSKNFALLSEVFTPTAFANYTGPLDNLNGLAAIEAALALSVANVYSQHHLGTTVIEIHAEKTAANSTTYFIATLFGNPYSLGSLVTLYGYYEDELVKWSDKSWLISKRQLVFQGPGFVGNLSLVGL